MPFILANLKALNRNLDYDVWKEDNKVEEDKIRKRTRWRKVVGGDDDDDVDIECNP
jgi:hypothetical protein